MNDVDPASTADRIAAIEEEIQELSEIVDRCRKAMLLSKAIAFGGLAALAGVMIGLIPQEGANFTFGAAAAIGGLVFFGANRSTLIETSAKIAELEALRARLVDSLPLRLIGDSGEGT